MFETIENCLNLIVFNMLIPKLCLNNLVGEFDIEHVVCVTSYNLLKLYYYLQK